MSAIDNADIACRKDCLGRARSGNQLRGASSPSTRIARTRSGSPTS